MSFKSNLKIFAPLLATITLFSTANSTNFCLADTPAANAKNAASYAFSLFDKRQYQDAAEAFETATSLNSDLDEAWFYKAICYLHTSDFTRARTAFAWLLKHAPNSNFASLAKQAMDGLSHLESAGDKLPARGTIALSISKQKLMLPASLNGMPVELALATGSNGIILARSNMKDFDLSESQMKTGVFTPSGQKIWQTPMTVTVGGITRHNVPVTFIEPLQNVDDRHSPRIKRAWFRGDYPGCNLIGSDFFKGYNQSLDLKSQTFNYSRAGTTGDGIQAPPGAMAVHAKMDGNRILLPVKINDHLADAVFDTAGFDAVSITNDNCEKNKVSFAPYVPREGQDWLGTMRQKVEIGSVTIGKHAKVVVWNSSCALFSHEHAVLGVLMPELLNFNFAWDETRHIMYITPRPADASTIADRQMCESRYQTAQKQFYADSSDQYVKDLERVANSPTNSDVARIKFLKYLNIYAFNVQQRGDDNHAAQQFAHLVEMNDSWHCLGDDDMAVALARYSASLEHLQRKDEVIKLAPKLRQAQSGSRIAVWQKSVQSHPENASYHLGLGQALKAAGNLDQAGSEYDAALRLDPNSADAKILKEHLAK